MNDLPLLWETTVKMVSLESWGLQQNHPALLLQVKLGETLRTDFISFFQVHLDIPSHLAVFKIYVIWYLPSFGARRQLEPSTGKLN